MAMIPTDVLLALGKLFCASAVPKLGSNIDCTLAIGVPGPVRTTTLSFAVRVVGTPSSDILFALFAIIYNPILDVLVNGV